MNMKVNYAFVCTSDGPDDTQIVKHICLYENEPNQDSYNSLVEELATDEEFGMVGDTNYIIALIHRIDNANLWELLELPAEINE
jgi:hypothetical protein